ncbi:MAG: Fe-S protein assembly co-chaperone HscB [Methylophilus sp.]|jgi:molecular chaperone HscB
MNTLIGTNYFELFGLTPRFSIDQNVLEQSFRRLQAEMHPDRFAAGTETEKRLAIQQSSMLNDGYRTLRHASTRAEFLINLFSKDNANSNVSTAFLMAQMEWREAIEEARAAKDINILEDLSRRIRQVISAQEKELAKSLDEHADFNAATQRVNELRFYEKLRVEIDTALDALDR